MKRGVRAGDMKRDNDDMDEEFGRHRGGRQYRKAAGAMEG